MKYPLRPEFKKYAHIHMPVQPLILAPANFLMPFIQKGRHPDKRLCIKKLRIGEFSALLFAPRREASQSKKPLPLLIYYHGGAFLIRSSSSHKNLAQEYALRADCAVLFVDYRLAPKHRFPVPVNDCFAAYLWAVQQNCFDRIIVGGDSAGGNLTLAVTRMARDNNLPLPAGQLLIYPVVDSRMETGSMKNYTDTPLWNSRLNRKMFQLYADKKDLHHPLISPLETDDFAAFPPTYIETAEFDCLHDEGILLAKRLEAAGIPVTLNETKGTMHGYEIAEKSPYVRAQVQKRIEFLRTVFF